MKSLTPFDWDMVAAELPDIIRRALDEDIGDGDVTSNATIPADAMYNGVFLVKAEGVIAGLEVVRQTFAQVDESIAFAAGVEDGSAVYPGDIIAEASGPARSLLTAERVALNFLQRMSGIATLTRQYMNACRGNERPHPGHTQDRAWPAPVGQVGRCAGRRREPSHRPL